VSPSIYQSLNTRVPPEHELGVHALPDDQPALLPVPDHVEHMVDELLVRNPRIPVTKVEVKSANHASFFELRRETDGTLNDDGGSGSGPFTLRITAWTARS